jgi:hypothetical protein
VTVEDREIAPQRLARLVTHVPAASVDGEMRCIFVLRGSSLALYSRCAATQAASSALAVATHERARVRAHLSWFTRCLVPRTVAAPTETTTATDDERGCDIADVRMCMRGGGGAHGRGVRRTRRCSSGEEGCSTHARLALNKCGGSFIDNMHLRAAPFRCPRAQPWVRCVCAGHRSCSCVHELSSASLRRLTQALCVGVSCHSARGFYGYPPYLVAHAEPLDPSFHAASAPASPLAAMSLHPPVAPVDSLAWRWPRGRRRYPLRPLPPTACCRS